MPTLPIKLIHNKQFVIQRKCNLMTRRVVVVCCLFIYLFLVRGKKKKRAAFIMKNALSTKLLQETNFFHRVVQLRDDIV